MSTAFANPTTFDTYLIGLFADAIRKAEHVARERRIQGGIPYSDTETIGLFTNHIRSIAHHEFYGNPAIRPLFELFTNTGNFMGVGMPVQGAAYAHRWNFKTVINGQNWYLNVDRACYLLGTAREHSLVIGYDEQIEDRETEAELVRVRSAIPGMQRIIREMDIVASQIERIGV